MLKPTVQQQQVYDSEALEQHSVEVDKGPHRPNKRQQADRPFPSPGTSQSTMPPPSIPRTSADAAPAYLIQDGAVKTPRPDFTCGFQSWAVIQALSKRGLSQLNAKILLEELQDGRNLYSDPTQHIMDIRFPLLAIEGKAHSTGKTIFEAENQAAVSGSSMLILRRQLQTLYDSVVPSVQGRQEPIAFSLCTQGPIMELWVHHIVTEGSITEYHMNPIATCHGSLCDELERFLLKVDCLISWYKDDYLGEIADQLFTIEKYSAR